MGIFDFLFKKPDGEPVSTVEAMTTSTLLAALIGDKLDERKWRGDMMSAIQHQLWESSLVAEEELRQIRLSYFDDEQRAGVISRDGLWMPSIICESMPLGDFGQLTRRWLDVEEQAEEMGIDDLLLYMPRDLSGNISSPPKTLGWRIKQIEEAVWELARRNWILKRADRKFRE